jgi:hypothetical protein
VTGCENSKYSENLFALVVSKPSREEISLSLFKRKGDFSWKKKLEVGFNLKLIINWE